MSDKPRPQLPEQAAQTIAASITAAIMDGMWDRDCEVVLQTAIARLVSGQVSHIPGVDSRPIPAPPDVETAAGKIATAVTERVNDWDKAAEEKLAQGACHRCTTLQRPSMWTHHRYGAGCGQGRNAHPVRFRHWYQSFRHMS